MWDIEEEQRLSEKWFENDDSQDMTVDELVYKVVAGFEPCDNWCASREYSYLGACQCIREAFPSSEHYELYLKLKEIHTQFEAIDIFLSLVNFPDCGENNVTRNNTRKSD